MKNILEVLDLKFTYKGKLATDDYTISLPTLNLGEGEVLAITGVSGSGKSTLLECLALLIESNSFNTFKIEDFNINELPKPKRELVRTSILGFMPQMGGLIPYLNIEDNINLQIEVALSMRKKLGIKQNETKKELKENALSLLKEFNLFELLKRFPQELSIGQRQRAVFIKAISHHPTLLLIDEPTSSLDPEHGDLLFNNIITFCKEKNVGSIVVTHDLNLVNKNNLKSLVYEREQGSNIGKFILKGEVNDF